MNWFALAYHPRYITMHSLYIAEEKHHGGQHKRGALQYSWLAKEVELEFICTE